MAETAAQLTRAIASGDPEAFARFYTAYFDAMYAEARRATGRDEAFCLDVVQDAMVRVIRKAAVIEEEAALRAWVRRVVLTAAYDRLRRDRRRALRESANGGGARPDSHAEEDGRLAWLERELAALDERTAFMLIARHRFGWTLARIGAHLGMKSGAVDGRINRAVKTLRERAKESFDDSIIL